MIKIDTQQSLFNIWRENHFEFKEAYQNHNSSFVAYLLPEIAVGLNVFEILEILHKRFGTTRVQEALNPEFKVKSPVSHHIDAEWIKKVNMVGVNIRTIGNFFNLIKYLLTVPESQNSVHILPIWEPGVVASLYGKTSWNINPEFFSQELKNAIPYLDTTEKQLKVVINLIHLMGKTVGMDVIPHTDRFSEMVLSYPRFFEWVKRVGGRISEISDTLHKEIEEIIWLYLHRNGTANQTPVSYSKNIFFDPDIPILTDEQKSEILFGKKEDQALRLRRRIELIQEIIDQGFETLPVTMAPPYRGLHINPEDFVYDERGNKWYTYEFDHPEPMSRVFGPLTRYKFYLLKDGSQELDFDRPNTVVWDYVQRQYAHCQREYNFDFMRGDMAHVQPRKDGVPETIPDFYDPLRSIKEHIVKNQAPYFGFFAETFLAPADTMGYGDENAHLEAILADSTLGDLQSSVIGGREFMEKLDYYHKLLKTKSFSPNYTMITGDKDDPRFDDFYKQGNHLRFFTGLFLTEMPSYMSLGFECRNLHQIRGKNEEYSKLYVFTIHNIHDADKVTTGPFIWGGNHAQFMEFTELRLLAEEILPEINAHPVYWISSPGKNNFLLIWQAGRFIFVTNQHPSLGIEEQNLQQFGNALDGFEIIYNSEHFVKGYECRIYKRIIN